MIAVHGTTASSDLHLHTSTYVYKRDAVALIFHLGLGAFWRCLVVQSTHISCPAGVASLRRHDARAHWQPFKSRAGSAAPEGPGSGLPLPVGPPPGNQRFGVARLAGWPV